MQILRESNLLNNDSTFQPRGVKVERGKLGWASSRTNSSSPRPPPWVFWPVRAWGHYKVSNKVSIVLARHCSTVLARKINSVLVCLLSVRALTHFTYDTDITFGFSVKRIALSICDTSRMSYSFHTLLAHQLCWAIVFLLSVCLSVCPCFCLSVRVKM